jgi:hypothetical protein
MMDDSRPGTAGCRHPERALSHSLCWDGVMATTISHDQRLRALPERAFALWTDPTFVQRRIAAVPDLQARLVRTRNDDDGTTIEVEGRLPQSWLPQVASRMAGARIRRVEDWFASGTGYLGHLSVSVSDAPVTCIGTMRIEPFDNASLLTLDVDISVDVPMLGSTIENMVAAHLKPGFLAEFALLTRTLAEPDR